MSEREDDLNTFMDKWRKDQQALQHRLYGKLTNPMQTTEEQAEEEDTTDEV